jgi:2-polyprenyl-6-methoxyphenol hydroxylase-like FAD-dependent oxidoreductase
MWGYYLQVPESALASVLVDDQERQQSGSVPFGKVHPEVRAALESRLAGLLPLSLFELVQQSGNSSIQAIYSFVPRSYARNRLCLVGDSGTLVPPFAGSGVLRAVTSAASLADVLAGTPAVDDALRRWSDAQIQAAAQVIPNTEGIERSYVFGMPDPHCHVNHGGQRLDVRSLSRARAHSPQRVSGNGRRQSPPPRDSGRWVAQDALLAQYLG